MIKFEIFKKLEELNLDKEKYVVSNIDLYAKLQELNFWKEKATNK